MAGHSKHGALLTARTPFSRNLQRGALMSSCGHVHEPFAYELPNRATVLCAGSLTLTGSFVVLDYEPGQHWPWQFHHVDAV